MCPVVWLKNVTFETKYTILFTAQILKVELRIHIVLSEVTEEQNNLKHMKAAASFLDQAYSSLHCPFAGL